MRVVSRLLASASALALALAANPAGADQLLGQPRIDNSNRVQLPGGPTLGRWQGNKFIATPDSIQIQGPGSTGPGSGFTVKPSLGAVERSLADRAQDVLQGADFGMNCNGPTGFDNTPKLVDALNASVALGGRQIVPPPGVCRLATAFTFPSKSNVNGRGLTTFYVDPAMSTATFSGISYGVGMFNVSNLRFEGLTFQGGGQTTRECPIISGHRNCNGVPFPRLVAINVNGAVLRDVTIRDFGKQGRDANAEHVGYIQGLLAFSGSDWLVDNSKFVNNSGDGIAWSNGTKRIEVRSSYFENNGDSGPVCTIGGSDFNFHGNFIVGQAGSPAPIVVMDRCQKWRVSNNTIVGVPRADGANTGQTIRVAQYPIDSSSYINESFTIDNNNIIGSATAISVESAGSVQAGYTDANTGAVQPDVSVPGGGKFAVTGNTMVGPDICVDIVDSEFGSVSGNSCSGAKVTGLRFIAYKKATGNIAVGPNTWHGTGQAGTFGIRQVPGAGGTLGKIAMGPQTISGFITPMSLIDGNTPMQLPTFSTPPTNADCINAGSLLGTDASGVYYCAAFNALRKLPGQAP